MTHRTHNELLVDLMAKRDWLLRKPTGMAALTTKRRIKEIKRELESSRRDLEVAEGGSDRPRLGPSIWYVRGERQRSAGAVHRR